MSKRPVISQNEAYRMKRELSEHAAASEAQRRAWLRDWPNSVHLGSLTPGPNVLAIVNTARRLGHAVAVTISGDEMLLYGSKL